MNILLESPLPPPAGGIATWTEKYLEYCKQNVIKVTLVNTATIGRRKQGGGRKQFWGDELIRCSQIALHTIKGLKKKPEIAHINTSCSKRGIIRDYIILSLIKRKKVRVIVQCHCNIETEMGSGRVENCFLKKLCSKADRVLCLNKSSIRYLHGLGIKNVELFPVVDFLK